MIDQDVMTEVQYALQEPPDGGQSWPSEVWTRDEVLDALNSSERAFIRETFQRVTRAELTVLALAPSVALPADWMASLHLVWRDSASGVRTPLGPGDAFGADLALPTWQVTQGTPLVYLDLDQATLTFRLAPVNLLNGVVELLYVSRPTEINGNGRSFTVSDDYMDAVKYGGLGWLLRKVGRLQDPERAAYCEQRFGITKTLAEIILGGWS